MIGTRRRSSREVRLPAVAGMFYPADAESLESSVHAFLKGKEEGSAGGVKAFILPHAGHVYSGPVAATGYAALTLDRAVVQRIVLLGPSHRVAFHGLAVTEVRAFLTPLGEVPVDLEALESLLDLPQVILLEGAHANEHSLEVHLPFLQLTLDHFKLVPLIVGHATAREVSEVLDRLWGGEETRIIVSSDLSHYHDYTTARRLDRVTANRIEFLQSVTPDQACGSIPVDGLLDAARRHGLHGHTLDLRNSGDTAGPRDRVVGYGAFAFR